MDRVRSFLAPGPADVALLGGKAVGLVALVRAGFAVPAGFVITTEAYSDAAMGAGVPHLLEAGGAVPASRIRDLLQHAGVPIEVDDRVRRELRRLGPGPVAVRSSATSEDAADASAAGQQETFLGVRGADAVLDAVRRCWASLWTDRAVDYRARRGVDPSIVRMAVVVQRMVDAESAGVLFTADPRTGRRDRAVIAAAWGLGEAVVGGEVDTDDLVVDRVSRTIVDRRIADKRVLRAPSGGGGTDLQPVSDDRRRRAVLTDGDALALATLGGRVEGVFGVPQDIEWARSGGRFLLLQARPITALPEPPGPVPTTWPVPARHAAYFRASIVEQLPDPLTPLFEDLAVPSVTASTVAVMRRLIGDRSIGDGGIALVTVNGYAYYRYDTAAFVTLLGALPGSVPRLIRGTDAGPRWWRRVARPEYGDAVARAQAFDVAATPGVALLEEVRRLVDAGTRYYTAVQTVIPLVATVEGLFTWYARHIARVPEPPVVFLLGSDSEPIRAERSLWDVAAVARTDAALVAAFASGAAIDLRATTPPHGVGVQTWTRFRSALQSHLGLYGHAVYSLDFADPVPADDPVTLLGAVRMAVAGRGTDPRQRQRSAVERRDRAAAAARARLDPVRRRVFDHLLAAARRDGPAREDALADVGLAWPTVRRLLLELGRRLTAAGVLERADDVFWLRADELVADGTLLDGALLDGTLLDGAMFDGATAALPSRTTLVAERRRIWRGRRLADPPQLLPDRGWAQAFERLMPAATQRGSAIELKGVAAGGGTVRGIARVITGPADFGRLHEGDILVAAITTPAWTPLFAVAAGVVTDIGGPLSHSSIVAREYGIPAVLGTGAGTRRIRDGQRIVVDGSAGVVRLEDAESGTGTVPAARSIRPVVVALAAVAGAVGLAAVVRRRR